MLILVSRKINIVLWIILSAIALLSLLNFLISPPKTFGYNRVVEIPKGFGSYATAKLLKNEGFVRSSIIMHLNFIVLRGESRVQAGTYLLEEPLKSPFLAKKIIDGSYGFTARRITLPEGLTKEEMAEVLSRGLVKFDSVEFLKLAEGKEGYLFPDTYFINPMATSGEVLTILESNYEKRLQSINDKIAAFDKPLEEIMIMASIVEEEARDEKSRKIVAGILWDRLKARMPLQVDATFKYINGKGSAELTKDDLKIDSPYNTYKYTGLPPTPIANPGLESILATVDPIETPYVYFLTGDDGEMYYGKSLDEHNRNKERYIKGTN